LVPQADRRHRKGVALIIAAAVAWSTAPFFTRLLQYDSWTILFWRGLFGGGFIALFLVLTQGSNGVRSFVAMKPNAWLVAFLSAFDMVNFIPALQLTSVANVAIIIAAQPFASPGSGCARRLLPGPCWRASSHLQVSSSS
jgi:drug/metabolite transporter (DMT)-like permease